MNGQYWLMASLLYGSGLRMVECLRLRVQDVDFGYLQLVIRGGKGQKDRYTVLPEKLVPHVEHQMDHVRKLLERDKTLSKNGVSLP